MEEQIMVSILCNAYNHETYIADAIESFLAQKTNFKYEIIIHDDASTDNTAKIILEYAEKYPDIIIPLLETENQYSKFPSITYEIDLPVAKGKYIAFCEGDDFWTDPEKLQIQVDIMEADSSIGACCHANRRIIAKNNKTINVMRATIMKDGFIDHRDCLSESNFPHFTSLMLRRDRYLEMPAKFRGWPVGDYPLRAYCLSLGNVYYIDRIMSSYRVMTQSSWSKTFRYNMDYRYNANKRMDEFLLMYDEYTNYVYTEYIAELIQRKDFITAIFTGRYSEAKESPLYASCGILKKLLIRIGLRFPKFAIRLGQIYSHIKNKIKP